MNADSFLILVKNVPTHSANHRDLAKTVLCLISLCHFQYRYKENSYDENKNDLNVFSLLLPLLPEM